MDEPDAVALSGSRQEGSYTRRALRVALEAAAEAGATTELVDLRELDLPPFDPDGPDPEPARRLTARVRAADAVLLGSPVYHGSYSSTLKDALDYCGRDEFGDTTVGLLAVAGGGSYPARSTTCAWSSGRSTAGRSPPRSGSETPAPTSRATG